MVKALLLVAVVGACCVSAHELRPRMSMRGHAAPVHLEPAMSHKLATQARAAPAPLMAASAVAPPAPPSLLRRCIAEAIGTGLIVKLGCGAVCAAKFANSGMGLFGIAVSFGIAVAIAIFAAGPLSGAHLNPAITLGFVSVGKAPLKEAPFYILAQIAGAFVASAGLYGMFAPGIAATELASGVVRGSVGSASTFAGAFAGQPNLALTSALGAFIAEAWAAAILAFSVSVVFDKDAGMAPGLAPMMVGAVVSALICVVGPLTGCLINPARDLGPRIVAAIAGWGSAAMPFAWVYSLGPIFGAIAGFNLFKLLIERRR